jgi:hypothetical protein|tara:strand:- start:2820 stop:3212 length:393 start_codon:yes stop_codon:yes gene_type:complete
MKTFKELIDEVLSIGARRAKSRQMKMMNRKASVQKKKERNQMRSIDMQTATKRATKQARKVVMQKVAGKGKNIADLSLAQKQNLEKRTNQKISKMGGAFKNLVKRQVKTVKKAHLQRKKDKMAAKAKGKE